MCHAVPSHLNRSAIMTAPLLLYKPTMQCFLFKRKWSVNSMNRPHHVSPILGKDRSECSRVKRASSTFLEKEWLERTVRTVEKERGPLCPATGERFLEKRAGGATGESNPCAAQEEDEGGRNSRFISVQRGRRQENIGAGFE